jgi:hypothetical protein
MGRGQWRLFWPKVQGVVAKIEVIKIGKLLAASPLHRNASCTIPNGERFLTVNSLIPLDKF